MKDFINKSSNYWFWNHCHGLCQIAEAGGPSIEHVAWMETPEKNNDYDVELYNELRSRLGDEASITVAEGDFRQGLGFYGV